MKKRILESGPCSDCGEYVGPGEWHECGKEEVMDKREIIDRKIRLKENLIEIIRQEANIKIKLLEHDISELDENKLELTLAELQNQLDNK